MAATDLFQEVGLPGSATNLAGSGYTIGGTAITVDSTTNWPSGTGVSFAMDVVETINNQEVRIEGSYCEFSGQVTSPTGIGSLTLEYGTPQNYAPGATTRVYIPVSSERENRLVQGLRVEHKQDGTHDLTKVAMLAGAQTFTGVKTYDVAPVLPTGAVPATALATGAITLGYAQKADANYVAASNAAADVPGLTVAVTVPAGGRRVKVTFCGNTYLGTAAGQITVRIMEGTAILATAKKQHASTSQPDNCTYSCILTPTAGAHTYKIQLTSTAGIPSLEIAATQPAYILVEAI